MENAEVYIRWLIVMVFGIASIYGFFKGKGWRFILNKPIRVKIKAIDLRNDDKVLVSLTGVPAVVELEPPHLVDHLIYPGKTVFIVGGPPNPRIFSTQQLFSALNVAVLVICVIFSVGTALPLDGVGLHPFLLSAFLVVGILSLSRSILEFKSSFYFLRHSEPCMGTVIDDMKETTSAGDDIFTPCVKFMDQQGKEWKAFIYTGSHTPPKIGKKMRIRYFSGAPMLARRGSLIGIFGNSLGSLGFALFWLGFVLYQWGRF